jgi:hypothetical protein
VQLAVRTGTWFAFYLDYCGHLCAATGRQAEAVALWAAYAALLPREEAWPGDVRRRQEPLRAARQALGPDRARAAEERGAAMGWAAAAKIAGPAARPDPLTPHPSRSGSTLVPAR